MKRVSSFLVAVVALVGCVSNRQGVTMIIKMGNRTETPQVLEIRQSLPEGAGMKDVLRHDGLELRQDGPKEMPYVYARIIMSRREFRQFNVDVAGCRFDEQRLSAASVALATNEAVVTKVTFRKLTPDVTIVLQEDGKVLIADEIVSADQIMAKLKTLGVTKDTQILIVSLDPKIDIVSGEEQVRIHNRVLTEAHKTPARIFVERRTK